MSTKLEQSKRFGNREQVEILLEEYRALNSLLLFRLEAIDRRISHFIGFLSMAVSSVLVFPADVQHIVLLLLPLVVIWIARTTIAHAKAKEDHLRRIDEIEQLINTLAGQSLMVFQSQHPNWKSPSGRSGQAMVSMLCFCGFFMLVLCVFLARQVAESQVLIAYACYAAIAGVELSSQQRELEAYHYSRRVSF